MRSNLWMAVLSTVIITLFFGQPRAHGKQALLVDYEMNPPVVLAELFSSLKEAGFHPLYRPFFPRLTKKDLRESSLVILLSGNTPGYPGASMTLRAVDPLVRYVRSGGILFLAPTSGDPNGSGGDHERYLFNLLLHKLGVNIQVLDDWIMDKRNAVAGPLYHLPLAVVDGEGLLPPSAPKGEILTDRSCSLRVGSGVKVLLRTYPSAYPRRAPQEAASNVLACLGRSGRGVVVVIGRHLLTWGGGNAKEPSRPIIPVVAKEEALRLFRRSLFEFASSSLPGHGSAPPVKKAELSAPSPPDFPVDREPLPPGPPDGVSQVKGWQPPRHWKPASLYPLDKKRFHGGIRAGWAYINRDPEEISLLVKRMQWCGMNALWGVALPHLLTSPRCPNEERLRLVKRWEAVSNATSGTSVNWLMGMEYPGRLDGLGSFVRAVGAHGNAWPVPSPWDLSFWEERVVRPARIAANWARSHQGVAGIVLDLEMYGMHPLYYGNGVDFGNGPYLAFLRTLPKEKRSSGWGVPHKGRFSWLRDNGLLERYYRFLERKARFMGEELSRAVRTLNPRLMLGTYTAGILHRWFYRGLWKGLSEPGRPVVLFTFQREASVDLEALSTQGIEAVNVRGLLLGTLQRRDYPRVFRESLRMNQGYWLNRMTSLVANSGYLPIEAPKDMGREEAWKVIRDANMKVASHP